PVLSTASPALSLSHLRPPPTPPLSPYTTLFRSHVAQQRRGRRERKRQVVAVLDAGDRAGERRQWVAILLRLRINGDGEWCLGDCEGGPFVGDRVVREHRRGAQRRRDVVGPTQDRLARRPAIGRRHV